MSNSLKIEAPEDTVSQMAHRAYDEYVRQHKSSLQAMRFPKWRDLTLAVKANWKQIVGKSFGMHGTIININPMNREPYTVILTGLTKAGMDTLSKQMADKMDAQKSTSSPLPEQEVQVDEPADETASE